MIVTSGTDWQTTGGDRRHFSISLDENDGEVLAGTDKWVDMEWKARKAFLTMHAEVEVLKYMHAQGALDVQNLKEYAQAAKNRFLEATA